MTSLKEQQEFQSFVNSNEKFSTPDLDSKILGYVKKELDPSHGQIFAKLATIQAFIGFISLLFCPQFDLSLTNNYAFFHYLHHTFGTYTCYAICGSIFIGSGAIFAAYLLKQKEMLKIKESRLLYYSAISSLAVLAFLFLGAEVYMGAVIAWLIGATLGGIFMLEVNTKIRNYWQSA